MSTETRPQAEQTDSTKLVVHAPRPNDVLCGRGKDIFNHAGNQKFRELIVEHAETYKMAPTKKQKMQVVMLITDIVIAREGRFLIRRDDGCFLDGGRQQGKKKTGHSFRDALRGRVQCIQKSMREKKAENFLFEAKGEIKRNKNKGDANESESSSDASSIGKEDFDNIISDFASAGRRIPGIHCAEQPHSTAVTSATEAEDIKLMISGYPSPPKSFNVQPSEDWMHPKVDKQVENDLLKFFLAKHL